MLTLMNFEALRGHHGAGEHRMIERGKRLRGGSFRLVALALLLLIGQANATAQECRDTLVVAPDPISGEGFGKAMAIDGMTMVVGAPGAGNGNSPFPGRALVYEWINGVWEHQATLSNSIGRDGDLFGFSVAIDGDLIVVGASRAKNERGLRTGNACVFRRGEFGWVTTDTPRQVLYPSDGERNGLFGAGIGISGDWIFVGAPRANVDLSDSGAAYAFEIVGSNWVERQKLARPKPIRNEHFGLRIAIEDGLAVIGAPNIHWHSVPGTAHVFMLEDGAWAYAQMLKGGNDRAEGDHFGRSVALLRGDKPDENWLVVGATGDDDQGGHSGSAFVYRIKPGSNGFKFVLVDKLEAGNGSVGDHFGYTVAMINDLILVGAHCFSKSGIKNVGAAYIFEPDVSGGETWSESNKALANCQTAGDRMAMSGEFYVDPDTQATCLIVGAPFRMADGVFEGGALVVFGP